MLGCEFVASNVVLMFVESLEEIVVQRKNKGLSSSDFNHFVMLGNAEKC